MKAIDNEKNIIDKLSGKRIIWKGEERNVIICTKPQARSGGECKTDVYILLDNNEEIKVSVKQNNADFLENKISPERFEQIFGTGSSDKLLTPLVKEFTADNKNSIKLYEKSVKIRRHDEIADKYTLGYRLDLTNKKNGKHSYEIPMDDDMKIEIYSGANLPEPKRNCFVGKEIVKNSGVANYYLVKDVNKKTTAQEIIDSLVPIKKYALQGNHKIYATFKAVNVFLNENGWKWDGNRPLAMYVGWNKWGRCDIRYSRLLRVNANERVNVLKKLKKDGKI